MKRTILAISLAALLLAGCAEVPEDVKQREAERQDQQSAAAADGAEERSGKLRYIPVSELPADVEKALAMKLSNFTISERETVDLPEEYAEYDFVQADGMDKNAQTLAERFYSPEELSKVTLEKGEDSWDERTYIYQGFRSEEEKLHCFVWDDGFFCMLKPPFFDKMGSDGQFRAIYHVDRNDDLSDKYLLGETEVTVAQAAEAAQKWVNENYAEFEPEYDFAVKTIIAKENSDGEYFLDITVSKILNGIDIDELREFLEDTGVDVPNKPGATYFKTVKMENKLKIMMKNGLYPEYFSNIHGYQIPTEKKKLNEIVSLTSAFEYIESTFTNFDKVVDIGDVNLKHILIPDYDYTLGSYSNDAGTVYNDRLVWEFIIDVTDSEVDGLVNDRNDIRKYIYIDAETGEMEFEFNVNVLLQ